MVAAPAVNVQGYTGSVNQVAWARMLEHQGVGFPVVFADGDLLVTATTGDRTVKIARTRAETALLPPGGVLAHGVMAEFQVDGTIALPAVAGSGSRWQMIVIRFDWVAKTVTQEVIQHGAVPNPLPGKSSNAGVKFDVPLAIVETRAGSTAIHTIYDLRCWARNGRLLSAGRGALQYMPEHSRLVEKSGIEWRNVIMGGKLDSVAYGSRSFDGVASMITAGVNHYPSPVSPVTQTNRTIGKILIPDHGYRYRIANVAVQVEQENASVRYDLELVVSGSVIARQVGEGGGGYQAFDLASSTLSWFDEAIEVTLRMKRMTAAQGYFRLYSTSRLFRAVTVPAV